MPWMKDIRRPRPTQGGARQGREVVNTKTIHNNNNTNTNNKQQQTTTNNNNQQQPTTTTTTTNNNNRVSEVTLGSFWAQF